MDIIEVIIVYTNSRGLHSIFSLFVHLDVITHNPLFVGVYLH